MGGLHRDALGGQQQDALDGLPVEDARWPRPWAIHQAAEPLGAVALERPFDSVANQSGDTRPNNATRRDHGLLSTASFATLGIEKRPTSTNPLAEPRADWPRATEQFPRSGRTRCGGGSRSHPRTAHRLRIRSRNSTAARISSASQAVQSSLSGSPDTPVLRPSATMLTASCSEPCSWHRVKNRSVKATEGSGFIAGQSHRGRARTEHTTSQDSYTASV